MKIFVINGVPKSGKDTFVKFVQDTWGDYRTLNISTVDTVKEIAVTCGWDGTKTPRNRAFLSSLKDLLTQWNNLPYNDIINKIDAFKRALFVQDIDEDKSIVFIHCREPEEIKKFVDEIGAKTLLVRREEVENESQSNHADTNVFDFVYDYTIDNNGTEEELREQANQFLIKIFKK